MCHDQLRVASSSLCMYVMKHYMQVQSFTSARFHAAARICTKTRGLACILYLYTDGAWISINKTLLWLRNKFKWQCENFCTLIKKILWVIQSCRVKTFLNPIIIEKYCTFTKFYQLNLCKRIGLFLWFIFSNTNSLFPQLRASFWSV